MTGQLPDDAVTAALQFMADCYPNWNPGDKGVGFPWSDFLGALEAAAPAIAADLRTQLEHAQAALAGDHEGIRLWMLDCGALVAKHRDRADAAEAIAARAAAAARARIAAVISPDQFRKLADWFDADDEFKEAMFPETWSPGSRQNDVQKDLRRVADLLDGAP